MAGINLLKQVGERDAEVEIQSGGGGSDYTVAEKIKLGLILAGGFLYYFSTDYMNNTYLPAKLAVPQAELAQIQQETGQVRAKLKELEDLKKFIEQHQADVEELKGRIRALNEIRDGQRDRAVRMVDYIVGQMPEPIWIEDLKLDVQSGAEISLKGYSRNYQTISSYFSKLEEGVYFSNWQLVNSEIKNYTPAGSGSDIKPLPASYFELKAAAAEVPQ